MFTSSEAYKHDIIRARVEAAQYERQQQCDSHTMNRVTENDAPASGRVRRLSSFTSPLNAFTSLTFTRRRPGNDQTTSQITTKQPTPLQGKSLPRSRTTSNLPIRATSSRIPTPVTGSQRGISRTFSPNTSGSRVPSTSHASSMDPPHNSRIMTPMSSDKGKGLKHVSAAKAFAKIGQPATAQRSSTQPNLLSVGKHADFSTPRTMVLREESSSAFDGDLDALTADVRGKTMSKRLSSGPWTGKGGPQGLSKDSNLLPNIPSKKENLEHRFLTRKDSKPLTEKPDERPETPHTAIRTARPSLPRLSSGHEIRQHQLLQPFTSPPLPKLPKGVPGIVPPAPASPSIHGFFPKYRAASKPDVPRHESMPFLPLPNGAASNPQPPKTPTSAPYAGLRTRRKALNNAGAVRDEEATSPCEDRSPALHEEQIRKLRQVHTIMPTAYWAGRFTSLSDLDRNELLSSCTLPINPRAANDGPGPSDSTETLATAGLSKEELRARRVFDTLSKDCTTADARASLRQFMVLYARVGKMPGLIGYVPVAEAERDKEADAAGRKGSFMERLIGMRRSGGRASEA